MKVALLSDCYLPRLGGIEVQVDELARRLHAAGHESAVFTATVGEQGQRAGEVEDHAGVEVHRFALRMPLGIPVNPLAPAAVRDRLTSGGFDVAHVHMGVVSPFAVDMARTALGLGIPTAITWHCVLDRSRSVMRLAGYSRRWAARGAALSAVSSMAARRVEDIAATSVQVLPNGIDPTWWQPKQAHQPDDGLVVVNAAMRLARRKKPHRVLSIVEAAAAKLPEQVRLKVNLFGSGPQRRLLQRSIQRAGFADTLTLRGRVTRDQLRTEHQRADIYLNPALLEAFGIAALEARTAGLPVIARRGTGVEDFVEDGINGRLAHTEADMVDALVELASDPAARARMAATNASTPPTQSWDRVIATCLDEYARAGAT